MLILQLLQFGVFLMITFAATITGADATGFTNPVYTATADSAPNSNSKQVALTGLTSGTAASVRYHSASDPFTCTYERPAVFKGPVVVNSNGVLPSVPRNVHTCRTRKGLIPVSGQNPQVGLIETKINVPAGSDIVDPANVKAMISAHIGLLKQLDNEWGDTVLNGVL
jgi:hypothetical protein